MSTKFGAASAPAGRFSRRRALQLAGAAGFAASAAACTNTSDVPSGPASGQRAGAFKIPDWSGAPKGDVKMRVVDSGDQKALYWNAFLAAYHKKFGNISVNYQGTNWNSIQQSITLGLRNGTAPDVFQLPQTITTAVAHKNNWLQAWDDVIPGWQDIKARMPVGLIADGTTTIDGKTYSLPVSLRPIGTILLINKQLSDEVGIDISNGFTLDSFGSAVRSATKKGAGKYYGLIDYLAQPNGMNAACGVIAQMSGMQGGVDNDPSVSINYKTGELNYTDPILADVIEWYLGLVKDKCFLPGSVSLDAPGARQRFPQGQSVFIFQGPWNIGLWHEQTPQLDLGVSLVPVQKQGEYSPVTNLPGGGNGYCIAANSKNAEIAGNMFGYLFSDNGQGQWAHYSGAGNPAIWPPSSYKPDPQNAQALRWQDKYGLIGPSPAVRNPDVIKATQVLVAPSPSLHDVCTSLFTGEKTDVKKELKALQDRANQALETAINTARKQGAKVSRDDWVFSDWDPKKPYTKIYHQ